MTDPKITAQRARQIWNRFGKISLSLPGCKSRSSFASAAIYLPIF